MGDLKPRIFVHFRAPRNNRPLRVGATHREATKPSEASAERRSCRGHLTQTEGRDGAETTGEGRPRSYRREAKGASPRPSSHGVDAPSQAALAARQMRRVFVVRAGRRQALIKRPFHFPNAPNMRICQCFQGFGLHSRPKTGDIPRYFPAAFSAGARASVSAGRGRCRRTRPRPAFRPQARRSR